MTTFRIVRYGTGSATRYHVEIRRRFLWWAWWVNSCQGPFSELVAMSDTPEGARRLLEEVRWRYANPAGLPPDVIYQDPEAA